MSTNQTQLHENFTLTLPLGETVFRDREAKPTLTTPTIHDLSEHLRERTRLVERRMEPRRQQAKPPAARSPEFVVYWMRTAVRMHENPALDAAIEAAAELDLPCFIYHAITEDYPFASDRHHTFMLQGAQDVQAEATRLGIGYTFHLQRTGHRGRHLLQLAKRAALVITEDMPVDPLRRWTRALAHQTACPVWAVDTACTVPMQSVGRSYDRAFAFRRATQKEFEKRILIDWPQRQVDVSTFVPDRLSFEPIDLQRGDWAALLLDCEIDHSVGPVPHTIGGMRAGYTRWDHFLQHGMSRYARRRNDPLLPDGVSRMSPYLHYGMVSPFRLARDAAKQGGEGAEKYLDELLIWRELAHNFCFYQPQHDTLDAIPAWAVDTLRQHASDARPQLLSWESAARGRSGEALWDAAQNSLLQHGELHNNVRMTWGKALLSWTSSPEEALERIVDLNHRYALDGRDPSSYGGILWCLGQFDRPFQPPQPMLGTVRSRNVASHAKRLDVAKYALMTSRPLVEPLPRVAVIGAGISGLIAARTLRDHGFDVTVFDKGRGVAGRMSTRRGSDAVRENVRFDHGAQYFTVHDPRFRQYVQSWMQDGIVARWHGRVGTISNGELQLESSATERFVAVPAQNQLCKHLAQEMSVHTGTQVAPLRRDGDRWQLEDVQGTSLGAFDQVIVTAPPVQAAEIVAVDPALRARIAACHLHPCWALMLQLNEPLPLELDGGNVQDSKLAWICRNNSKPGRDPQCECWVAHAGAEWSTTQSELDPETARQELMAAFWQATGLNPREPQQAMAHRWRYSLTKRPADRPVLQSSDGTLTAAGDWCLGNGVEGAFLSGMAAAGCALRTLIASPAVTLMHPG